MNVGLTVLDPRLRAVATMVTGPVVADIGTNHALLPRYLLERGLAERVIAVELNQGPWEVARQALMGYQAEIRLGDGFAPLESGEVDCACLCGLGARRITEILSREPQKVPSRLVLQANRGTSLLRIWARESGFHLLDEAMAEGFWTYSILAFERRDGPDPAYRDLPQELAQEFGPHLLRARDPLLCEEVNKRERHFRHTRAVGVHRLLCEAQEFLNL